LAIKICFKKYLKILLTIDPVLTGHLFNCLRISPFPDIPDCIIFTLHPEAFLL